MTLQKIIWKQCHQQVWGKVFNILTYYSLANLNEGDCPTFLSEYNDLYQKFSEVELLIEGPEFGLDYSYFLVDQCEDLKDLERGIPLSKFASLAS